MTNKLLWMVETIDFAVLEIKDCLFIVANDVKWAIWKVKWAIVR